MKRLRQFLATMPVLFFATAIAFVLAEVAARQALVRLPPPVEDIYLLAYSDDELRRVYNGADPGPTRAMLEETWRKGVPLVYAPFVEFVNGETAGQFVNVSSGGYRFAPPDTPLGMSSHKVFVFGGSTTFGMGVADAQTLPARIGSAIGPAATVYNFGTNFHYSTQSRILFERFLMQGLVPNVAVFVDGLNDFYFCATGAGSALSARIDRALNAPSPRTGALIAQRSNVVQLAQRLAGPAPVPTEKAYECTDTDIARAVRRLDANRREIAALGAAFGVEVVFVQQPVPTYAYDAARRVAPVPAAQIGMHAASRRGYPLLVVEREAGRLYMQDVLWLERESIAQNMYVDAVHYSPEFNDHLARLIAPAIAAKLAR